MNTAMCTIFNAMVGMVQTLVDFAFLGLNIFGFVSPPVITWFQPLTSCTLG